MTGTRQLTDPQELDNALKRMHIDPNDYKQVSMFQSVLREKLGGLTRGQQSAFSDVYRNVAINFPKYEVKQVTFLRLERPQTRYFIPGMPGLFGYVKASEYVRVLMEK